jgi:hypothetical protein
MLVQGGDPDGLLLQQRVGSAQNAPENQWRRRWGWR